MALLEKYSAVVDGWNSPVLKNLWKVFPRRRQNYVWKAVGDVRRNSKVVLGGKELKSRLSSNTWALGYLFGPRQSSGKGTDVFPEVPYSLAVPFNISTSYGCRYPGPLLTLFNPHFSKCEYCFSAMPLNSPLAQTFRTTVNCLTDPCLACLLANP